MKRVAGLNGTALSQGIGTAMTLPAKGKGGLDGRVISITTKANGEHLSPEHQNPIWQDILVRPART